MTLRFVTAFAVLAVLSRPALAEPPPAGAVVLDHIAIHVRDLDASAGFYRKLFGFGEVKAPVPRARWLVMGNGLSLHIVAGRTEPLNTSKWDHFAVSCADMAGMIARLDAMKIAWSDIQGRHAPQTRGDGVQQIFVRDPDGYWIEINDALKPR